MDRELARMGKRGIHMGFWWKSQKERPLGRLRHRWEIILKLILER
jgi:hypothetical protein